MEKDIRNYKKKITNIDYNINIRLPDDLNKNETLKIKHINKNHRNTYNIRFYMNNKFSSDYKICTDDYSVGGHYQIDLKINLQKFVEFMPKLTINLNIKHIRIYTELDVTINKLYTTNKKLKIIHISNLDTCEIYKVYTKISSKVCNIDEKTLTENKKFPNIIIDDKYWAKFIEKYYKNKILMFLLF